MGTDSNELSGFVERKEGHVHAILRSSIADELVALNILDPARFLSGCEPTGYGGRMVPLRVRLSSGEAGIVRLYRRGGAARFLTGAKYLGVSRPFKEARVSEHLRGRGVPTPEVLAAVHVREMGVMHSGFIVTREVPGAETIRDVISREGDAREILTRRVPEVLRALHDAGVAHRDLTVDNVLVGADGAVVLVDLDGCAVSHRVGTPRRMSDLLRFRRSVHKNDLPVSQEEWRAFYETYAGSDDWLRRQIEPWLSSFERNLFWYKLGWKLGI